MIALKTGSFAVVHLAVAFSVAYALTGDIGVSSALALLEPACNTVAFYFHERVWRRFQGGKFRGRKRSREQPVRKASPVALCCPTPG